jgi:phosphatidylglycerophosphate synthase
LSTYKGVTDLVTNTLAKAALLPTCWFLWAGISLNLVTLIGMGFCLRRFAVWGAAFGFLAAWIALLDTVDGKMARVSYRSPLGEVLITA